MGRHVELFNAILRESVLALKAKQEHCGYIYKSRIDQAAYQLQSLMKEPTSSPFSYQIPEGTDSEVLKMLGLPLEPSIPHENVIAALKVNLPHCQYEAYVMSLESDLSHHIPPALKKKIFLTAEHELILRKETLNNPQVELGLLPPSHKAVGRYTPIVTGEVYWGMMEIDNTFLAIYAAPYEADSAFMRYRFAGTNLVVQQPLFYETVIKLVNRWVESKLILADDAKIFLQEEAHQFNAKTVLFFPEQMRAELSCQFNLGMRMTLRGKILEDVTIRQRLLSFKGAEKITECPQGDLTVLEPGRSFFSELANFITSNETLCHPSQTNSELTAELERKFLDWRSAQIAQKLRENIQRADDNIRFYRSKQLQPLSERALMKQHLDICDAITANVGYIDLLPKSSLETLRDFLKIPHRHKVPNFLVDYYNLLKPFEADVQKCLDNLSEAESMAQYRNFLDDDPTDSDSLHDGLELN